MSAAPTESVEVRSRLVDALKLDLIGPWAGHPLADEKLHGWIRPSNWYLTGFVIPTGTPPEKRSDEDENDDFNDVGDNAGLSEESSEERQSSKKAFFPSSMGLSFLLPAAPRMLSVVVRWGDYEPVEIEGGDGKPESVWQRTQREERVTVDLRGGKDPIPYDVPNSGGLQLSVVERALAAEQLEDRVPQGTCSVSIFLVNHRPPHEAEPDRRYAFQPELEVRSETPFVPRPDLRGIHTDDWDERLGDLHYADTPEYATGHGVSAEWDLQDQTCRILRTSWIPTAEVERTETSHVDAELSMDALGALKNGPAAVSALRPVVDEYRDWIKRHEKSLGSYTGTRRETAEELLRRAGVAATRIEKGLQTLESNADALDAFRLANRAVARGLKRRLNVDRPEWRPFQLAFILLNLPGLAAPAEPHRDTVDLLFFPTGGGKTEAYLGLAAFAMVMRRLRHPGDKGHAGAGVSVIMRYTLRLLTLDQLGRAAGLVCALELEREADEARYGKWPFEIGLWVGKAATPNVLGYKGYKGQGDARSKVRQFQNDPRWKPSPIPLENCPWCGTRFTPSSFALLPNADKPNELRIVCADFECEFSGNRALPILAVDEPIYRRLPAFLIATVDKFASLPFVGPSGMLLGGATHHDARGFYGAAEPGHGTRLEQPLPPPDLVIQDELHLISGPLGTMAGLYEAGIEALCSRKVGGKVIRPKIIASTATVRRAQDQVQALFARANTEVFPPPGPDRRDSFFARTVPSSEAPARLYVGVASPGRNPKVLMRKAWLALMAAAEKAYRDSGGPQNTKNPADPYMTVLGYFNSLRELGGARRILEEEVQNTIKTYGMRRRVGEDRGLFLDRNNFSEVLELTSRVPTSKVAEARRRLEAPAWEKQSVDCAIATNMISVGLDIPRLGLMVVLGQPKTHAEYIQATSRVGRQREWPGLVVTLHNIHKPRDRSHYERFRHYHETFYRSVEVTSVTPFSARALDRGFAGAMVTLARHLEPSLTPAAGVEHIRAVRASLEQRLRNVFMDRVEHQPITDENERQERLQSVQSRVVDLLDSWIKVVEDYEKAGAAVQYQPNELNQRKPLLREMLDTDFETEHHRKFRTNRSLRDVEPDVGLVMKVLNGGIVEDAP